MTRLAEIEFLFKWKRGREQIFGLFAESCTFLLGAFPFHITIHGLMNTLLYLNKYKEISIEKRMSIDAKTAVLLHELTHGLYDDFDYKTDRNLSEVFVESVAYMVASYFRTRQFNVYF